MSTIGSRVITPDFIDHPWVPLQSAHLQNNFVKIHWPDGAHLQAYSLWLAENSEGIGVEPLVRESLIDPADLPAADALVDASVDQQGALLLTWKNSPQTRVHPGWLRYVAEGKLRARNALPRQVKWIADIKQPPTVEGRDILENQHGQELWLDNLVRYGFCRLENTPTTVSFLSELSATVGAIRATNFGTTFSVKTSPNPDSTANTGLRLGQHTDLPTREAPPGYQLLHCLTNNAAGGDSRLTDGLAVIGALADEQPDAFELLCNEKWLFMNRAADAEHRWEGSIIELPVDGRPLTLRAFYPVRSAPLMAKDKIPAAYEAMRTFSRYAHDARFQISYPFKEGDLVTFDNRRIMHGRNAFAADGERHLHGCYIDHDEIYSRLRVLRRNKKVGGF